MPCQQNNLVSVSGNHCLVACSVIPVDASDSFDTILDVESMRLYKKCDTEVIATIKRTVIISLTMQ